MITVPEVFSWLNLEEGKSHLTPYEETRIGTIKLKRTVEPQRQILIDDITDCANGTPDILERGEVFVNLGVIKYNLNARSQSSEFFIKGLKAYRMTPDFHRQAVTELLLFIVRRSLLESNQAYSHARAAMNLFADKQVPRYRGAPRQNIWYQDRLTKIRSVLFTLPDEAYEWISKFEPSRLGVSAAAMVRDKIRLAIADKCFDVAYQQIDALLKLMQNRTDSLETAEAYAFCGLSAAQMGNQEKAIRYLKYGMVASTYDLHVQACIRWMLGLVQYGVPAERINGINNLEACIPDFQELIKEADRNKNLKALDWYKRQMEQLKPVLKELVSIDP